MTLRLLDDNEVITKKEDLKKLDERLKVEEQKRLKELSKLPEWQRKGFKSQSEFNDWVTWHGYAVYSSHYRKAVENKKETAGDKI